MLPHSYTVDSLSQSQDLAYTILSSSTPSQISSTCASIHSFLHSHTPDQLRHFFSLTFPALIRKLFGFDDATATSPSQPPSNGWIDTVLLSDDPNLASTVFSLLSPNGTLFHSISSVDRQSLVKYVFPIERLPEWTRFMISSEAHARVLADFCPLFKGKVNEDSIKGSLYQIQLSVFEYYMFWFAYYPICRGNNENSGSVSIKKLKKFKLENWAYSIRGFSSNVRKSEQNLECNLYLRLLYAYLKVFVPIHDLSAHQMYCSSLLHYSNVNDGSIITRAEFLVNTLVHYWLVDNDFSPFPVNMCKSFGVSFPLCSVLGETPPTAGLGEVVKLFVKYLNLSTIAGNDVNESNSEWKGGNWRVLGSPIEGLKSREVLAVTPCARLVGSWNVWIQRPLYRFILRTFLFCPVASSMKNVSQVFSVWVTYMEPWMISLDGFSELDALVDSSGKNVRNEETESQGCGYSSSWEGYVLSNYLYYSSLIMHFIGFAHKFLHTDPEVMVQMVLKAMNILTSSKELIDLIRNVYTAFHSKQAVSGKPMLQSLYRYVPLIQEQLQDWEDGLCESDADGSFLHENWNKDLRLFSDGEDGGQQLLQLFILRAEAELQAISGDSLAQNLESVDSLKAQVSCLFGGHTLKPFSVSPEVGQRQQSRDDIFKPKKVGNHALGEIKYKGDWMKRPVSDDEVAWLVKLLIWLSNWLNESLRLNQAESSGVAPKWSYVEVSNDVGNVYGPMDTMKAVLGAIGGWLFMLAAEVLGLMRKHGVRVNLRMLASKKVVMVLLIFILFCVLKRTFGMLQNM
ncbi:hypothetical protein CFOL_v3_16305 [Cephalotus follicularis]|uniref:Uncharacterized protein n=1 Tax=Cephalotus follicularis TaxID=3775 RepID=A0A1Q3BXY7_CEPFO|nr:hypothetical protein CFOL_v3_16305 [Cephalotus follicularis]